MGYPTEQFKTRKKQVDRGLIAMFLKMTPEQRIVSNDNAIRSILELRDAFKRQREKISYRGPERAS